MEELGDFESNRRDPLWLLGQIKEKMYDPARAKYEFTSLTETLIRLLGTKQEDNESLVDYTKRFKQARDIFKTTFGNEVLYEFIQKTREYREFEKISDVDTRNDKRPEDNKRCS